MHFNFHLSGDESPEQSRRIANAVLALGGLLTQTSGCEFTEEDCPVETNRGDFLDVIRDGHHPRFVGGKEPTAEDGFDIDVTGVTDTTDPLVTDAAVEILVSKIEQSFVDAVPPIPTTSAVAPSGLDSRGLPWDERIHSSSRAINADGTWRYRKNVPDETKRDVEAELRGLVQATPAAPPVPIILPPSSVTDITPPSTGPTVPGLVPPAPPVPTGALRRTYSDVVNLIMSRKVQPDIYVAILGMSLPEFAKHVISAPNDATIMFDALDAASRT